MKNVKRHQLVACLGLL